MNNTRESLLGVGVNQRNSSAVLGRTGTVGATVAAVLFSASVAGSDLQSLARQYVAGQNNVPAESLEVGTAENGHFPLTGASFTMFKFFDPAGNVYGATLDNASGRPVDHSSLAGNEAQARRSKFGVIESSLWSRMTSDPSARIPVAVWMRIEDSSALVRVEGAGKPDFAGFAARAKAAVSPAAEQARGLGAIVRNADMVPVFFADLNAGQIRALSTRVDVASIEFVPQDNRALNDDSATSDRFTFIWSSVTGAGARVAVHEAAGVIQNQFLHSTARPVTYWRPDSINPSGSTHATNVAGVIASTHNWRRGGAFGVSEILSANFQQYANPVEDYVNAASWAIRMGADVINMSWGACSGGSQSFYGRWVDYLIKNFGVAITISSGNNNCGSPDFVMNPSLGWNTISVGSYFDNNTGRQNDDVFSSFSSYRNPTNPATGGTYEKPDVVAMGGQLANNSCFGTDTTDTNNGVTASTCGTSFSSPDTAAVAALVVGEQPALRGKAEAIKAIVMAGATHNITDGVNYRDCATSPFPNDCRDGAGGINAYQTIKNVVTPGNWRWLGRYSPTSPAATAIPVSISKGKNIRVVMAWDSTASCSSIGAPGVAPSCSADALNADMDLRLIDPSGATVSSSLSVNNSAEVIDYKTLVAGTYTIRVNRFSMTAGTDTYVGVAWNLSTPDTLTPLTSATGLTLGVTKAGLTTDKGRSFWDNYQMALGVPDLDNCVGFMNASSGLEKVFTVKTVQTGRITATLSNLASVHPNIGTDLDVAILKKSGAADAQNGQMIACGNLQAIASSQPAGTYYVVVDGFSGSVANFSLNASFLAGLSAENEAQAEALPVRQIVPEGADRVDQPALGN